MLIDTHCHLDAAEFDADRVGVAARASAAGVTTIVVPAVERANFGAVASICREFPQCRPAYGIHPMYVDRAHEEDLETLRETLSREPAVAIGEIGLDGFVEPRDEKSQSWWYAAQLQLAREFELPVLLHVRRAVDGILKELRRIRVPGGIAHAFNGSRQQADEFIKLGFKLGFGGAMTHPRATRLRELAATLPLESIVLETDAPDIPPEWLQKGRNEPGELARIAMVLAELRQSHVDIMVTATTANAFAALPRLKMGASLH
ncbi:MAG: TatD family hydrolase [Rhodocyclales bacterium]|nr:TatD family hydrolase [Rhodocyclales bacterium]MBI5780506.1 TatD family hydrolase [Rhodocyclales bacterium]